ncbi:hypothetical protein K1719_005162 [Acacia pycnantha]|nr:hypothetical protein K1719_005162 [Acacia pycnantha]
MKLRRRRALSSTGYISPLILGSHHRFCDRVDLGQRWVGIGVRDSGGDNGHRGSFLLFRHSGSLLTHIFQVVAASLRKRKFEVQDDKPLLYEIEADTESAIVGSSKLDQTSGLSFFDKAAVVEGSDDGTNALAEVEEIRIGSENSVKANNLP